MKKAVVFIAIALFACISSDAQQTVNEKQRREISSVIANYSLARETRDTILLKRILTHDIDQLVSSGEWRDGVSSSVKGMLRSSANSPGKRTLTVHTIRLINNQSAIVDCRYDIENTDGTSRKMWSTFILVLEKGQWKISAIRNMLPSAQ
jgi:hypothetical protein